MYIGARTWFRAIIGCLCFVYLGIFIVCCPIDNRDAYKVNDVIYDAKGNSIGAGSQEKFIPEMTTMGR
jgi:hypothetical protein